MNSELKKLNVVWTSYAAHVLIATVMYACGVVGAANKQKGQAPINNTGVCP